jgi:arginase family enzyme
VTVGTPKPPLNTGWREELDAAVGDRPLHFHLDCDVLEPGLVPTDHRVPHGLTFDELGWVATRLAANRVVGAEVAEFEATCADTGAPGDPRPLLDALSPLVEV